MGDWQIKSKHTDLFDGILTSLSNQLGSVMGVSPEEPGGTYMVENTETGEIREVYAPDRDELGERISRGDFDDD